MDPRRDDRVIAERAANHVTGRGSYGGRLIVTNKRLAFRPHRLDRAVVDASAVEIPLDEVAEISVTNRDFRAFPTGLRCRLRVARTDGTSKTFMVNRVYVLAAEIEEVRRSARGGS